MSAQPFNQRVNVQSLMGVNIFSCLLFIAAFVVGVIPYVMTRSVLLLATMGTMGLVLFLAACGLFLVQHKLIFLWDYLRSLGMDRELSEYG